MASRSGFDVSVVDEYAEEVVCLLLQMSNQLELWGKELEVVDLATDVTKAEHYLQQHNESVMQMQTCVTDILQRGDTLGEVSTVVMREYYCTNL